MTATEKSRIHRFVSLQLLLTSLIIVIILGCNQNNQAANAPAPSNVLRPTPPPVDTPIVISGGSIHFKAKHSAWQSCNTTTTPTTCVTATFSHTDKPSLKNYIFVNDNGVATIPITGTSAWEVDIVDINPDNNHKILVCAESSSPFTSCNSGSFTTDSIYVIATGGGTFKTPDAAHPEKIVYHDGNKKYDDIGNIFLNAAGGTGGQQKTCTDSHCFFLLAP